MRTYIGLPGDPPLLSLTIVSSTGSSTVTIPVEEPIGWGKGNLYGGNLARLLLTAHTGDYDKAETLHRRFMWRTVMGWNKDLPFKITDEEIEKVIAEIEDTEKLVAAEKAAASRMVPPVENEAGIGVGGGVISKIENKG